MEGFVDDSRLYTAAANRPAHDAVFADAHHRAQRARGGAPGLGDSRGGERPAFGPPPLQRRQNIAHLLYKLAYADRELAHPLASGSEDRVGYGGRRGWVAYFSHAAWVTAALYD